MAPVFAQRYPRAIAIVSVLLVLSSLAPLSGQPRTHGGMVDAARESIVRIGVFGLFHPQQLEVRPVDGEALVLRSDGEGGLVEKTFVADSLNARLSQDAILMTLGHDSLRASSATFTGRSGEAADFILSVPGKISRHYHGTLAIKPTLGSLEAILSVDREAAEASIVAAESDSDAPLEALKAQAIATRSYLVAGGGRHRDFDFCDTTHCQFLREAPTPDSAVAKAVAATRGIVLAYNAQPFPAMYTRSCAGKTHTPGQVGMKTAVYSYYSVECAYCRTHPQRWTSRIAAEDASSLHNSDESSRLRLDRRLGWSAVPSNDFVARKENDKILLVGAGNGHGVGLCQAGAKAMAAEGASFREILNHYYPNTTLMRGNQSSGFPLRN